MTPRCCSTRGPSGARRAAAVLAAAVLALSPLAAAGKPSDSSARGVRLYHHSFENTLTYDDTLGEWLASAATMPLRDRVMIMPAVKNRYATLFSKKAIETADFEARFTMSATDNGENRGAEKDGAVAFWISLDDFAKTYDEQAIVTRSKDWGEGLKSIGHTLIGNRPEFRGLVVAFFGRGPEKGDRKQHIAALWNDGSKSVESAEDLLDKATGAQVKAVNWMTTGTEVSVRVARDGSITGSVMVLDLPSHLAGSVWGWAPDGKTSEGTLTLEAGGKVKWKDGPSQGKWVVLPGNHLKLEFDNRAYVLRFEGSNRAVVEEPRQSPEPAMLYGGKDSGPLAADWVQVFKMPPGTFPMAGTQSFVGFTGFTGTKSYVEVDLHHLWLTNFDMRLAGEDDSDLLASDSEAWLKVLEEEKRYVSQASQTEAIRRLLKLMTDHVDRYDRLGEQVRSDLVRMEDRLDKFGADLSNYLAATQAFSFEASKFTSDSVKEHIAGIKSVLTKNRQAHDEKLETVHKAAQDLKETKASKAMASEPSKRKVQVVAEKAQAVTDVAAEGSTQTNLLLFLIVAAAAGMGLLFLNRMRYYEKKHYI